MAVCSECKFVLTNEYPNIFVDLESNKYLQIKYIFVYKYSNIGICSNVLNIVHWIFAGGNREEQELGN